MEELKLIARLRSVKNYENLSRIRLVEETGRLEPSKKLKKKKIVSSSLLKGKKVLDLSQEKVKRKINKKEVLKLSLKKKLKKYKKLLLN